MTVSTLTANKNGYSGEFLTFKTTELGVSADSPVASHSLIRALDRIPEGGFLFEGDSLDICSGIELGRAYFEFDDTLSRGVGGERGVSIGNIALQGGGTATEEKVAVKPQARSLHAAREYTASKYINAASGKIGKSPRTFSPLGFWRLPITGEIATISRYQPVEVFDEKFWQKQDLAPDDAAKAICFCIQSLDFMHEHDIVHQDSHSGNFGRRGDVPWISDLNWAESVAHDQPQSRKDRKNEDVWYLFESILVHLKNNEYAGCIDKVYLRPAN